MLRAGMGEAAVRPGTSPVFHPDPGFAGSQTSQTPGIVRRAALLQPAGRLPAGWEVQNAMSARALSVLSYCMTTA